MTDIKNHQTTWAQISSASYQQCDIPQVTPVASYRAVVLHFTTHETNLEFCQVHCKSSKSSTIITVILSTTLYTAIKTEEFPFQTFLQPFKNCEVYRTRAKNKVQ